MGWENVFHCEWNEFGKKVLKYYWPKAKSYEDITTTDFTIHRGKIDILTGGFPCQPYSTAGKRLGKEDDRHLWPEMLRAIREIQPTYVVGENVLGLVNWDGGLVFNEVQADLEAEGYEVQPFVLPACAVNAPHRRDRVWFVAYCNHSRNTTPSSGTYGKQSQNSTQWQQPQLEHCGLSSKGYASNTIGIRPQIRSEKGNIRKKETTSLRKGSKLTVSAETNGSRFYKSKWQSFPTQSPICIGNDGLSSRLDGITFSKWRNESIKAAGNAIVPQVVYQIFQAISKMP
jgi:DNA (cytosine-5)-methyltransferase 1